MSVATRPARPRRLPAAALVVAVLLLALSLLRPLRHDDGWLLEVAGRPVDLAGQLQDRWVRLSRHCQPVTRWPADSPVARQARQVLAAYSPPASQGAQPVQLLGWGAGPAPWLLAEVRWDGSAGPGLDNAIVPLRRGSDGRWQVQAEGVWSGTPGPWWGPTLIRRYLRQRLPAVPEALVDCLDPTLPPFVR